MHLSQVCVHFYYLRGYATAPARPPIIVLDDESPPPPLQSGGVVREITIPGVPQERDLSEVAIWLASESNWV